MQLTKMVMGLLILLLIITPVSAQFLSPTAQVHATLPLTTTVISIGNTHITGEITGIDSSTLIKKYTQDFPIDEFLQTQYNLTLDNLHLYPIINHSTIPTIKKITLIELEDIDFTSLEDLITLYTENIHTYTNINITTDNGLFIYATPQPTLPINQQLTNTINGIITFPFQEDITNAFLAMITQQPINFEFTQTPSILLQPSDQGTITITSENNNILWHGSKATTFIIIEDPKIILQQEPPLYLLPLETTSSTSEITLQITPSNSPLTEIPDLLNDIQNTITTIGNTSTFELPLEGFNNILNAAAQIINGALILINTTDTIAIDQTPQYINQIGFFRGDSYQLTISPQNQETNIDGTFRLIFLGDHLYTTQAPHSDTGITLPWTILIIWIIAIALLIYTKFYYKNKPLDTKEKHYPLPIPLLFHLLLIIITFILIDREISFQFGVSALDTLLGPGINEIFAITIAIQLIMWIIGYILLTIPTRIILKIFIPYIIKDTKTSKSLARGLSLLSIWIFTALYLKLIINILLLYIGQQLPILPT